MYKAIEVAHWFINKDEEIREQTESEKITLLKVLKLLYYAEGCYLASFAKSLFPERILAWEHGPVVEEVYKEYPNAYELNLTSEDKQELKKFSKEDDEFLGQVYDVFGQYTAWGLRNMTHKETPWIEATDNGTHLNGEISRETMKTYFEENYIEN